MKRWPFTILLFLLMGALVNVAVAWSCIVLPDPSYDGMYGDWTVGGRFQEIDTTDVPTFADDERFRPFGVTQARLREKCGVRMVGVDWLDKRFSPFDTIHGEFRTVISAGWPLKTLSGLQTFEAVWDGGYVRTYNVRQSAVFRLQEDDAYLLQHTPRSTWAAYLPLLSIWPNFAVNTLFYALLLWLPICGPFALRRQIRKRRGRCLKCGYPAGESPTCTECGSVLPARRK